MQTTHTSVLARRTTISTEFVTLPHEAGWASEAVFFVQADRPHRALTVVSEISPDGINWVAMTDARTLAEQASLIALPLTTFGNWIRVRITGATETEPARVLVHLVLKG